MIAGNRFPGDSAKPARWLAKEVHIEPDQTQGDVVYQEGNRL
jgi:hypothetical protein